ncbi:MAG TPA: lipocalin family protein [Flavisolibacter sp.]|jgi:hypothetical protein|nr:lipocalin family protein [Flavisolibacter sp.]
MKKLLLVALSGLVFTACKKNDSGTTVQTKSDLLAKGTWKFESGGIDANKDGNVDINFASIGTIPDCTLDNTITFSAGGTGIVSEGATRCDPSNPPSTPFNWSFSNSETTLNLSGNALLGLSGQFKVITLSDTRLSLSKDTTVPVFNNVAVVVNLQH